MGRSALTNISSISTQDITLRLQQLISNWGGARQLREAMVETLVQEEEREMEQEGLQVDHLQRRIKAIHKRLTEIVDKLRKA